MSNRQDFERFAVQYWGQKAGRGMATDSNDSNSLEVSEYYFKRIGYLELRSIGSLTDEELIHIGNMIGWDKHYQGIAKVKARSFVEAIGESFGCYNIRKTIKVIDYLRSIGILVPFAQYSVEEILSLGWAVVKK